MTAMQVTPRAALITGATSGIGEAFARAMPAETSLLLVGRNQAALDRIGGDLRSGRVVETLSADLASDRGIDEVCAAAEGLAIDLLVLNAGVGPYGEFVTVSEEALRETVSVNVMAPVVLSRRLLPGMIERADTDGQRAGLIIVSSNTAFLPVPKLAAYAASKAFDLALAESLAAELAGRPIATLALCPTMTRSRFAERSGFGRTPFVAQSAGHVARRALRALGRQHTLILGPVSGPLLMPQAMVRAAAAQVLQRVLPRR